MSESKYDTTEVSFNNGFTTILESNFTYCHNTLTPAASNAFDKFEVVKDAAKTGQLPDAIFQKKDYEPMPESSCQSP